MPAVAVTDMNNLFALIQVLKAALGSRIKPIVGVEVWVRRGDDSARLVLLCQDLTGYRNMTRLVSRVVISRSTARRADDRLPLAGQ